MCNLALVLTESAVAERGLMNVVGTRDWGNGSPEPAMYINGMGCNFRDLFM